MNEDFLRICSLVMLGNETLESAKREGVKFTGFSFFKTGYKALRG